MQAIQFPQCALWSKTVSLGCYVVTYFLHSEFEITALWLNADQRLLFWFLHCMQSFTLSHYIMWSNYYERVVHNVFFLQFATFGTNMLKFHDIQKAKTLSHFFFVHAVCPVSFIPLLVYALLLHIMLHRCASHQFFTYIQDDNNVLPHDFWACICTTLH